jgi:putative SOS response-associated peptidase YedK
VFCFAGIWRLWTGERIGKTREHHLFSFLTTEAKTLQRPLPNHELRIVAKGEKSDGGVD